MHVHPKNKPTKRRISQKHDHKLINIRRKNLIIYIPNLHPHLPQIKMKASFLSGLVKFSRSIQLIKTAYVACNELGAYCMGAFYVGSFTGKGVSKVQSGKH
jgi:hypothetical protein